MKLSSAFYERENVTHVARDLLGKVLLTKINKKVTSGLIVETEAYSYVEKGCHAYGSKKTIRNESMFQSGGVAYVYLCYGIHQMMNVVTNRKDLADAVLVRAIEPIQGMDLMLRRHKKGELFRITSGPGKLTRALGIQRSHNGLSLSGQKIWIEDIGHVLKPSQIEVSTRIGIDYAGTDAKLPWRFAILGNDWISK